MSVIDDLRERFRGAALRFLFPTSGETGMAVTTSAKERTRQTVIATARKYYDGDHKVYLTDRQKEWMKLHNDTLTFTVNHCPAVVDAVVERLKLVGFLTVTDEVSKLLWKWWLKNEMDAIQTEIHRMAVRDGEAFLIVDWDQELDRPEYIPHPRYVAKAAGGDGYGIWMEYPYANHLLKPTRAVKMWEELLPDGSWLTRRTEYYNDRVEKWALVDGGWQHHKDESDEEWPTPWIDKDGNPLGLPVTHFKNPGLKSELKNVIPIQDSLNKTWIDLMASADTTGFRMIAILGFIPTKDGAEPKEDGSNLLHVLPGQMIATKKSKNEADIKPIEPADLDSLLSLEDRLVYRIATITATPLSRFSTARQIAAEGTLKQQEAALVEKVRERGTVFGNAWEAMATMSLKLALTYSKEPPTVDPSIEIEAIWRSPETRDTTEELKRAESKKRLGFPFRWLLSELGYSEEQIEKIMNNPEVQNRLKMVELATVGLEEAQQEQAQEETSRSEEEE